MKVTLEFCPKKFLRLSKKSLLSVGVFTLVALISGCGSPQQTAAESAYGAAQAACATSARTLADSRLCRWKVDQEFGLCGKPPRPCTDAEILESFETGSVGDAGADAR